MKPEGKLEVYVSVLCSRKFANAVRMLAVGTGPIHERLIDACMEICIIDVEEDVPEGERQAEVEGLMERVTKVEDGEQGAIAATIERMSADEARELAELIVALNYQLEQLTEVD